MACWQPIIIQHLRSLPLIAQSAVEKTATLWSAINPEQFSNSWCIQEHTFSSKRHKFCQIDMLDFVIVAKINMKMTKILTD